MLSQNIQVRSRSIVGRDLLSTQKIAEFVTSIELMPKPHKTINHRAMKSYGSCLMFFTAMT